MFVRNIILFRSNRKSGILHADRCAMKRETQPTMDQPNADPVSLQLARHTMRYHRALEEEFDRIGRARFGPHGDRTPLVTIIKASDGYLTFYQPSAPPGIDVADGYHGLDYRQHDLNEICQSLSLRYLRVASPKIGDDVGYFLKTPDSDLIWPGRAPYFTDQVIEALKTGQINTLPVMDVSPVVYVEQGVRKQVTPGRVSIWSPVIELPAGPARLYRWTHAELWWQPEGLELDSVDAYQLARMEALALITVLRTAPALEPAVAQADIGVSAAAELRRRCEEFSALLDEHGHDEEAIHQWLMRDGNGLFLDSDMQEIRSKVKFGNYISDFVVRRSDKSYKLVEIEPAAERVFVRRLEPSARFNHARQQVRDWRRLVRQHPSYFEKVTGLADIYEPAGMVVMGRSADIPDGEARERWKDLKNSSEAEIATYDEIIERVRNLGTQLESMLGRSRD